MNNTNQFLELLRLSADVIINNRGSSMMLGGKIGMYVISVRYDRTLNYSLIHRPTTFVCGHSTCIDHTYSRNPLLECSICRHPLNEQDVHNVSYNLKGAVRLYHATKDTFDYSTVKLPLVNIQTTDLEKIIRAEVDSCQPTNTNGLKAQNEESTQRPTVILVLIFATISSKLNRSIKNAVMA
ncbi:hypothetical protein I4U23_024054 [Adineta vaga]|nr:hypothetical protein I4U23_024054 [Adineta vaga]